MPNATASIFSLSPALVLLPVAGLLLNLIFGKRMREGLAGGIASLAVALTFALSVVFAITLAGNPAPVSFHFLDWIQVGTFNVGWVFRIDTLSVTMMMVVSGVGSLIHLYAIGYMHEDVRHNADPGRFTRFFVYLNLFIAMMMILVSADNYLMLFVGWEGVGLCSYLLIGFWFEKGKDGIANAQAAKKAFVVNRIGDFGLLIALFLMFWNFGSLDFNTVFEKAPAVAAAAPAVLLAMTLFMLLGVTGKSAQIPLYVWLPDAMAGPTPVSALIHAATMVTAGVYLVVRSTPLFILAPASQAPVMWVGAATALFAATIALGQSDIKKVLAYSTISQLGFMVAAAGMGAGVAAMFHLITHAFFKALLFLGAGSVILGMEHGAEHAYGHGEEHHEIDPQDMRNMGGMRSRMPRSRFTWSARWPWRGSPPWPVSSPRMKSSWRPRRAIWVSSSCSPPPPFSPPSTWAGSSCWSSLARPAPARPARRSRASRWSPCPWSSWRCWLCWAAGSISLAFIRSNIGWKAPSKTSSRASSVWLPRVFRWVWRCSA